MPKTESTQHKLSRVRAPRVHITYDVEIGDAIEMKELPFVLGVLGDFSGKPDEPLPGVKDRKFIEIDRDNFDTVLAGMKPRLAYRVDNKLTGDGSTKLVVELNFKSMDDFDPAKVAEQVPALKELLDMRHRLTPLMSKMEGNDKLEALLAEVLTNTEKAKALAQEMGISPDVETPKES